MFAASSAGFGPKSSDLDQTSKSEREAQQQKLDELVGLLLSAGYFRARVSTLTPFDKVVGGMCWCITSSGAAVDVNIMYSEDLNLGQKIQLSENIIKVLRNMGCPSPLQANQIQGSDFVAIFPVIQWLVKLVLENRAATGDSVRKVSESMFVKAYAGAVPPTALPTTTATGAGVKPPKRQFRRPAAMWRADLPADAKVTTCLLEYGEKFASRTKLGVDSRGKDMAAARGGSAAAAAAAATAAEEAQAKAAEEAEAHAMAQLQSIDGDAGLRGKVVGVDSDTLRRSAAEYREREAVLRAAAESGELVKGTKLGRAQAHRRAVNTLRRKIAEVEAAKLVTEEELDEVTQEVSTVQAALTKATTYNQRVVDETAKLDAVSSREEHKADLAKLRNLVALNEGLKAQEAQFKANCAQQLASLKAKLEAAKAAGGTTAQEAAKLTEIETTHEKVVAKHTRLRAMLAARNQDLARLRRLIDDIPSRSELIQYERRFVELFDQVAAKLQETRKYYATYNALDQKRAYLSKEEDLVSQLQSNFLPAMASKQGRNQYSTQCATIVASLQSTAQQQLDLLDNKRKTRDIHAAEYQRMIEEQRKYFRAVKVFQEECDRNEALLRQTS